jgi:hypothetical protein
MQSVKFFDIFFIEGFGKEELMRKFKRPHLKK